MCPDPPHFLPALHLAADVAAPHLWDLLVPPHNQHTPVLLHREIKWPYGYAYFWMMCITLAVVFVTTMYKMRVMST